MDRTYEEFSFLHKTVSSNTHHPHTLHHTVLCLDSSTYIHMLWCKYICAYSPSQEESLASFQSCMYVCRLINPRRACARVTVLVWCVCVCVCVYPSVCLFQVQLLQRTFTPAIDDSRGFLVGFSWILIRGFSKKTFPSKVMA